MFAGARTCNNDPDSHPSKWLQSTEDNEIVAAWELTVATVAGIVTVRDQPKLYVISISLPFLDSFPQMDDPMHSTVHGQQFNTYHFVVNKGSFKKDD